ncbi:hypothetical protein GIB67_040921 [Kingdonia uniflora]|uniref:DUF4005 domain-containing protein n=1 Tax=Kingdonia uniflora TaxID=39325 RepID=A0A7J7PCF1_9MAGN|nr:hypothetical protein GIB67_040921 [Kingdonia uniflora]
MGKTGKWLRNFLAGKKDKDKDKRGINQFSSVPAENPTTPIANSPNTPKEKRRWSFRRSATNGAANKDSNSMDLIPVTPPPTIQAISESETEQKKYVMATRVEVATAADESTMIPLTSSDTWQTSASKQDAAAIKIQSVFRSFLARKALCALKGLVKLQALVRGHLVRKQATATLRCMQALVTVQARARAQRIRMVDEAQPITTQRQSVHRRSLQDNHFRHTYNEMDRGMEENIKIVEMDLGESRPSSKSRNSYSNHAQYERVDHRSSPHYSGHRAHPKPDNQQQISPAPSAMTDMSPRTCSGHFEEYFFGTAQSSPHYFSAISKPDSIKVPFAFPRPEYANCMSQDYSFFPNYMANTESSKAKVRSQSAPKQRPDSYERQPSRRRPSMEGRNIPRAVRMQRSSSHIGSAVQEYHYPWSIKLDQSSVSLKESECGSNSTALTNTNYCRSLAGYDSYGCRY